MGTIKTRSEPLVLVGLASIIVFGFLGCGERAEPIDQGRLLELVRQRVEAEEEVTQLLCSLTDEKRVKEAWPVLVKLNAKLDRIVDQFHKMKLPPAESVPQIQQFAERLESAKKRQKVEVKRIREELPGGMDFFNRIEALKAVTALNALKRKEKP